MSRSKRCPAMYIASGATPKAGKKRTSRQIRRTVRQQLRTQQDDFDFVHEMDKNRGRAGSRDEDYGWDDFGDGKYKPSTIKRRMPELVEKLSRK